MSTYPHMQILVVDNQPSRESTVALRRALPSSVRILTSETNLGYGGAANVGIANAVAGGADLAWILNNDVLVEPECLSDLVVAMQRSDSVAACSPIVTSPVGKEAPQGISFAGGRYSLWRAVVHHDQHLPSADAAIQSTSFITGCAMLLRVSSCRAVGGFFSPLFLYWEDVDLCAGLTKAGYRLAVVPDARVHHELHGSVPSDLALELTVRNAVLVALRRSGRLAAYSALFFLSVRIARGWLRWCLIGGRRPTAETRGLGRAMRALARPPGLPGLQSPKP